ncbi:MAG: YfhO family protein, partial [Acidimicrobiales bacterium]
GRLRALGALGARPVVAAVLAVGVGTALAAVAIVPFLQLLHHSSTLTARPRSGVHVQAEYVFAAFLPTYFPGSFEIETAFYVGALPLMLGVVALFRPRVERVAVALAGAACVLVVLGVQPLFALAGHTPGLDETYLDRLTIVYVLCVALLAGWGLDDLLRRRVSRRQAVGGAAVAVGILVLPLVVVAATGGTSLHFLGQAVDIAWLFARNPLPHAPHVVAVVRLAALVMWCTVAAFAVVLLLLRLGGRLPARLFAVLAIALVVGDLFQAGMGYNPAVPDAQATQPVTAAIRYLQGQQRDGASRYVAVTPYNTVDPLPPDVNLRYHLYDLRGYDFPVPTRFGKLWQRYVAPPTPLLPLNTPTVPLTVYNTIEPSTMRILSLFGVRDVLEQKHEPVPNVPGLRVAYDGPDATIYRNLSALPRTWLVADQVVVPGAPAQLARVGSAGFHPRTEVLTGTRLPGLATASATALRGATGGVGAAHIDAYAAEQVTITAHASRAAELVLSDTWFPGWQVTVNGRAEPISEVDYLLRGVSVPAGTDRIVFTYRPSSYTEGWVLSLLAAVVVALAVGWELMRRRRRPHERRRGTVRGAHARGAHARGAAGDPGGSRQVDVSSPVARSGSPGK